MVDLPEHFHPDSALHPGKFLGQEIAARGISPDDLARLARQPVAAVEAIVAEQQDLTDETATAIGRALGINAQFWLNLQSLYDQTLERMRQDGREPVAQAD